MKHRRVFALAGLFFLLSTVLSLCLGAANLSLSELWQAVLRGPTYNNGWIFWYSRFPRTIGCLLSGAALAVSGAIIQAVLNNKLASPSIIGVNAGAGLAVTLCCSFGFLSGWAIAGSSFLGALLSVLAVMFVSRKTGASRSTVILSGVAINSFLNAISEGIVVLFPDVGMLSGDFRVGGFSSINHNRLIPAGILIVISLMILFSLCNELDVLSLGEESAQGLGMNVKRTRLMFLLLAAMLAGASVSFAGLLGFVGLIVPHGARKLVGSESRVLIPLCALGGAGFVCACDLAARLLFAPYELPVGILMAVLGGPFFLLLLAKRKGGHSND